VKSCAKQIDEVESLTGSRTSGGSEPGDALRVSLQIFELEAEADVQVVNAVLTQLDKLRTRENVLVLTTSNLSHAIGK
jgi:SpoVK/Ycf46/Vps4 family AAA+-type ATPase